MLNPIRFAARPNLWHTLSVVSRPAQTAMEPNQRCRFACRQVEQVRKPIYFVTLKTRRGDGTLKDVSFSCTLQEIQDLLFRLKDACKQAAPN